MRKRPMRKLAQLDRRRLTIAGIVLAVILFLALNTFGSLALRSTRLDLTENRQFTLSPGTVQLLGSVKEPITLRFYASRALRDANDAWAVRESEVGREALLRSVDSYLEAEPPARRWQARDDLAVALSEYTWADPHAALLIRAAMWPEPALQRQHPAAAARLERALTGASEPLTSTPLAPAELAAALAGPNGPAPEIPAGALAFVPVDQLQPLRLELVRHHPDFQVRLRSAVAVATTGGAADRLEALRLLLAELARRDPARRDAVVDLLLAGLTSASETREPMVPGEDDLLALVFGLTRDPARARREIKGQ